MIPLLPTLAGSMANGFQVSREGCFLWATDAVVREFSEGAEMVDRATSSAVFQFYEQQAVTFLRILNDLPPENLPDGKLCVPFYIDNSALCVILTHDCSDRGLFPSVVRCGAILPQGMHILVALGAYFLSGP